MRTIRSRHEWIKSACKTMSFYSETNNTICPYCQRLCEIAQKTHRGSLKKISAWPAWHRYSAVSDRCHRRGSVSGEPQTVVLGCDTDEWPREHCTWLMRFPSRTMRTTDFEANKCRLHVNILSETWMFSTFGFFPPKKYEIRTSWHIVTRSICRIFFWSLMNNILN